MPSLTEENYLKAIFSLSEQGGDERITTNAIAERMQTAAASVTEMLKRLADKGMVEYARYKGAKLTDDGAALAKDLIRKHRLWEVFLMRQLGFAWDEVHEMAEDLEHVDHSALIDRLEEFLEYPEFDPHGDPIPDRDGNIRYHEDLHLDQLAPGEEGVVVAVLEHSPEFLQYLDKMGLVLQTRVRVAEVEAFDGSRTLRAGRQELRISEKVAKNLVVRRVKK